MPAPQAERVPHGDVPQVQTNKVSNADRIAQLQAEIAALEAPAPAPVVVAEPPVVAPDPVVAVPAPVLSVTVPTPVLSVAPVPPVQVENVVERVAAPVATEAEKAASILELIATRLRAGALQLALFLAIGAVATFIMIGQARPAVAEGVCDSPWSAVEAQIENSGLKYSELSYIQRAAILAHVDTDATITHIYAVVVPGQGLILVFVAGDCVEGVAPVSQEAFDAAVAGQGV